MELEGKTAGRTRLFTKWFPIRFVRMAGFYKREWRSQKDVYKRQVISKLSNAARGLRELAAFIELCRIKMVRVISIHDRVDTRGELFLSLIHI